MNPFKEISHLAFDGAYTDPYRTLWSDWQIAPRLHQLFSLWPQMLNETRRACCATTSLAHPWARARVLMSCGFLVDFFRCVFCILFSQARNWTSCLGFRTSAASTRRRQSWPSSTSPTPSPVSGAATRFFNRGWCGWCVCVFVSLLTVWGGLVILLDARSSGCSKARGRNEPGLTPTKPPSMLLHGLRQDRILRLPSP